MPMFMVILSPNIRDNTILAWGLRLLVLTVMGISYGLESWSEY